MEILQRYIQQVGEDLALSEFNIKEAQMRLPARKHYWVARLIEAKIAANKLEKEHAALVKNLTDQVKTHAPVALTPSAIKNAVESNSSVATLVEKLKDTKLLVEYLEKVEKVFSSMHWEIKNIVDIQKMEQL